MKNLLTILTVVAFMFSASAFAGNYSKAKSKMHHSSDIVDIASTNGSFNTLVTALKAADLVDTLKGDGPFTVFAPTDKAFASLPKGTLDNLLKPENKQKLVAILTYHVVPGKIMAKDVIAMKKGMVTSVEGSKISVDTKRGVTVDNANVTKTDINASNGVIHVIDRVIMPNS